MHGKSTNKLLNKLSEAQMIYFRNQKKLYWRGVSKLLLKSSCLGIKIVPSFASQSMLSDS
jgi:hypothetical protein